MDKVKIFLEDGNEKLVNCIFYLYNSKYYFLYTLNELDENGYIKLYLVKIGKETTNTPTGPVETGNMVGIEVPTDEEWKEVQGSISKIVNSKKTKIEDKDIQYLPINMLTNLKIVSKKTFRLLAGIIENDFGINLNEKLNNNLVTDSNLNKPIDDLSKQVVEPIIPNNEEAIDVQIENDDVNIEMPVEIENQSALPPVETPIAIEESNNEISNEIVSTDEELHEQVDQNEEDNSDIIIDYRTRFFEEQEKNKHLNDEIEKLKEKLNNIDKIIKGE